MVCLLYSTHEVCLVARITDVDLPTHAYRWCANHLFEQLSLQLSILHLRHPLLVHLFLSWTTFDTDPTWTGNSFPILYKEPATKKGLVRGKRFSKLRNTSPELKFALTHSSSPHTLTRVKFSDHYSCSRFSTHQLQGQPFHLPPKENNFTFWIETETFYKQCTQLICGCCFVFVAHTKLMVLWCFVDEQMRSVCGTVYTPLKCELLLSCIALYQFCYVKAAQRVGLQSLGT